MYIDRLNNGEKLAGVSAAVLLVALFSPWYGWTRYPGSFTAWQAFTWIDLVLLLLVIAGLGLAVLAATDRTIVLPVSPGVIVAALGGLAVLLVLYRVIEPPGFTGEPGIAAQYPDGFPLVRLQYGAWLGFVSVGGLAMGGMLSADGAGEAESRARQPVPGRMRG